MCLYRYEILTHCGLDDLLLGSFLHAGGRGGVKRLILQILTVFYVEITTPTSLLVLTLHQCFPHQWYFLLYSQSCRRASFSPAHIKSIIGLLAPLSALENGSASVFLSSVLCLMSRSLSVAVISLLKEMLFSPSDPHPAVDLWRLNPQSCSVKIT